MSCLSKCRSLVGRARKTSGRSSAIRFRAEQGAEADGSAARLALDVVLSRFAAASLGRACLSLITVVVEGLFLPLDGRSMPGLGTKPLEMRGSVTAGLLLAD